MSTLGRLGKDWSNKAVDQAIGRVERAMTPTGRLSVDKQAEVKTHIAASHKKDAGDKAELFDVVANRFRMIDSHGGTMQKHLTRADITPSRIDRIKASVTRYDPNNDGISKAEIAKASGKSKTAGLAFEIGSGMKAQAAARADKMEAAEAPKARK